MTRQLFSSRVALIVATLFAAHPVHTEAVAAAVNQSELVVCCIIAAITAWYIRLRRAGDVSPWAWSVIALAYVAAILFKETGFVIPAFLVAAELWVLRTPPRAVVRSNLVMGLAVLAVLAAAMLWLRSVIIPSGVVGTFTAEALSGSSRSRQLLTMLGVVPQWLRLLVWPSHLQVDYSPGEIIAATHFGAPQALGAVILLSVAILFSWAATAAPRMCFGIAWCAIALFPVSNLAVPTGVVLAERTLLIPSIGFLVAIAAFPFARLTSRLPRPTILELETLVAIGLVLCGVVRSAVRERDWRNNAILWYHTVLDAPLSYRAQHAFGAILFQIGQPKLAQEAYARAIDYSTQPWLIRNDLADKLRDRGQDTLALPILEQSVHEDPSQPQAVLGLVADLIALGRYSDAQETARAAVARGFLPQLNRALIQVADSAARAHAPAGSVRLKIRSSTIPVP